MRFWLDISLLLGLTACVSNERAFSDKVTIEPITSESLASFGDASYKLTQGVENLTGKDQLEWFNCTLAASKPTFVLLGGSSGAFKKADVCQHPAAAELLVQGFNVLAINRSGQGQSSGSELLGDQAAVERVLQFLNKRKSAGIDLQGLWAYGEASIEAFRLAKRYPFAYLIVGDAIYDWEATLKETQDPAFKSRLQKIEASSGEANFAEARSIAWDFGGLPKSVYLYHNSKNRQVSSEQAAAFKASLAASEYKVELLVVESEGGELPGPFHRGVIQKILLRLKSPLPSSH